MKLKTSLILLCVMFVASSGPAFSQSLLKQDWSGGCLIDGVTTRSQFSTCCNRKLRLCQNEKNRAGVRIRRAHDAECKAKHQQCLKFEGMVNTYGKKTKKPQRFAPATGSKKSSKWREVNRKKLKKK